jgi:hypothetical protein
MIQIVRFPAVPPKDDTLHAMIQAFLDNSGEPELSVETVYEMMSSAPDDECVFFSIEEDHKMRGYLFAQLMIDEYSKRIVWVHSAYVNEIRENFWVEMESRLHLFAKLHGCSTMYFTTRRNPKAFVRLLRTKWVLDSYVLKHEFKPENWGDNGERD